MIIVNKTAGIISAQGAHVADFLTLKPGANFVTDAEWEKTKAHQSIADMLEDGRLEEKKAKR